MLLYLEVYIKYCRRVIYPEEDLQDLEENPKHHWLFVSSGEDSELQIHDFQQKFGEDREMNRLDFSDISIVFWKHYMPGFNGRERVTTLFPSVQ